MDEVEEPEAKAPAEVLVEVFERVVRRLEDRVAIAESHAVEVERRMGEALVEARHRADESRERALVLESMLEKSAEERMGLIAALQEAIKLHQLQTAAPVAIAQAEAERELAEGSLPAALSAAATEPSTAEAPRAESPEETRAAPNGAHAEPAPAIEPVVIGPRVQSKTKPKPGVAKRFGRFFSSGPSNGKKR